MSTISDISEGPVKELLVEILTDGGKPDSYKKWSTRYDVDLIDSLQYVGHHSIAQKWSTHYNKETLIASSVKHKIFDAGCGTGLVGEAIINIVPRDLVDIIGGDISQDMIDIAESKSIYTDLRTVNLKELLPYKAESFDSVLSAGVFLDGHCGPECLPHLFRVLKKKGYFIATVRHDSYKKDEEEWKKAISEGGCTLIEAVDMPYRTSSLSVVIVAYKN